MRQGCQKSFRLQSKMQVERKRMAASRAELGRRGTTSSRPVHIVQEKRTVTTLTANEAIPEIELEATPPPSTPTTKTALYNERMRRARNKKLQQTTALMDAIDGPVENSEFTNLETAVSLDAIIPDPIFEDKGKEDDEKEEFTQRNGKWYDADNNEIKPKQVLRLMWGDRHYDIVLRRMRKVRQSKKTAQT